MRKWVTLLMTLLVGCTSYANANTSGQFFFEAGYRRDTIDWRHQFPSRDPIEKSSIKFKDLDIFQLAVHGRATLGCNFYARGNAYWGWILDGTFQRDYNRFFDPNNYDDNNLRLGFNDNTRTTIDDKYVFGVAGAIGYPFFFCDCSMTIAPVIGYAFDEQNIRVDDKGLDLGHYECFDTPTDGKFCNRAYISRWYGPFVGVDFEWRPFNSCFDLWAEVEYHWGDFRGRRSQLDDENFFDKRDRHSRRATAWSFAAGFDYDLCNNWTVGLSVKFLNWEGNRHNRFCDKRFDFDNYTAKCDDRQRTDNKWRSYAVNLTFGREF